MAVKGVFASDQNIQGTEKRDFAGGLLQTMPTGSAPFLALTAGMEDRDITSLTAEWAEEGRITGRIQSAGTIGSGTTLLSVVDGSTVVAGQMYLAEESGEYIFVDSVTGNALTIIRGFAGTTAATITNLLYLQYVGSAFEEGSAKPTSYANVGTPVYNYVQNIRNSWDATGTAKALDYAYGNVVAKNRREAAGTHAEIIERNALWGRRTIAVRNGKPFRTMNGVVRQIETGQSNAGAITAEATNTTWGDLLSWLEAVYAQNIKGKPNERIFLTDNTVITVLNRIAALEGVIELMTSQTEFGLSVTTLVSPFGNAILMTHPLMNEAPYFHGTIYALHPGAVRMSYLRRTHEDANDVDGSRAGADADFGVFTTECTVEYRGASTGGIYTGISTAAVTP